MTPQVFIYSRYSHGKQAKGHSTTRQDVECRKLAATLGLPISSEVLKDHGVSAYSGRNMREDQALGGFISAVRKGRIARGSCLILDSIDRFSRGTQTDFLHALTSITREGVMVASAADNVIVTDKSDMVDYLRVQVVAERAHNESLEKGRKVGMARAAAKAEAAASGKVWHRSGPSWCAFDEATKRHVPIAEKAAIVQRVFDLIEAGLGTTAIARRFNDEAVPTPKGRDGGWHHSAVLEIAHNRAVLGEYQPKSAPKGHRGSRRPADGPPIAGYYPAVIDEAQFHRVQAVLARRGTRKGRGNDPTKLTNLLQGLGQCYCCNGRIGIHVASRKGGKPALVCNAAVRRAPNADLPEGYCTNRLRYRYDTLEASILANVSDFDVSGPIARDTTADQLAALIAERDALQARVGELLNNPDQKLGPTVMAWITNTETAIAAKDAEIVALQAKASQTMAARPMTDHVAEIVTLRRDLDTLEGVELYDRRAALSAALKAVIDHIDFDVNGDVRLILCGGLKAYRFNRAGEFVDGRCVLPFATLATDRPTIFNDPQLAARFQHGYPVRVA